MRLPGRTRSGVRAWRSVIGVLAGVLFSCLVVSAHAACLGTNLLPELRESDRAGIEQMFAQANTVPNANGRLWKVQRGGVQPSYLFGTFHSNEALDTVPPDVWARLEAARIAIFEVGLDQQAAMQSRMSTDPSFVLDLEGPGVLSEMTAEQRRVFGDALATRGIAVEAADRMRPWLLTALLAFPACHLQAMAGGSQPLDAVMANRAVALGIEEVGLEGYEVALSGLDKVATDVLMTALTGVPEMLNRDEDLFRTNHALYESGQTQAISELGIYLTERYRPDLDARRLNRAMMVELLDVRNQAWMPRLRDELSMGNAFVAVGALHLPGELGLVELLREAGFTVTRLDE